MVYSGSFLMGFQQNWTSHLLEPAGHLCGSHGSGERSENWSVMNGGGQT